MLGVKWKDIRLTSKPLSFSALSPSQKKSKGADDSNRTAVAVQMTSDSNSISDSDQGPLQVQPKELHVIKLTSSSKNF